MADLQIDACATERIRSWNAMEVDAGGACVVYWMARCQRTSRNLAFDVAVELANGRKLPLVVVVNLSAGPPGNDLRHVAHMISAFPELARGTVERGAAFAVRQFGAPGRLSDALMQLRPAAVVTDGDVMPHALRSRSRVGSALGVPLISVETDVVIPTGCFERREYGARTIRPKVHRMLDRFAGELGSERAPAHAPLRLRQPLPEGLELWTADAAPLEAAWVGQTIERARGAGIPDAAGRLDIPCGLAAGRRALEAFVEHGLHDYARNRNQPHVDGTSGLSVFLHCGHLSVHEILDAVRTSGAAATSVSTFVEELVVRRELAWNYTLHTPACREWDSLPEWSRATLRAHQADPRRIVHTEDEMQAAETSDPLWNAAQRQMIDTGTMHGYLRMYWAKQLLTWTEDPQRAFETALRLHDTYSMDARDPNSIVGVAWAIGGVHDRPWPERDVFGTVRSMTLASTGRKFDSKAYIARFA